MLIHGVAPFATTEDRCGRYRPDCWPLRVFDSRIHVRLSLMEREDSP